MSQEVNKWFYKLYGLAFFSLTQVPFSLESLSDVAAETLMQGELSSTFWKCHWWSCSAPDHQLVLKASFCMAFCPRFPFEALFSMWHICLNWGSVLSMVTVTHWAPPRQATACNFWLLFLLLPGKIWLPAIWDSEFLSFLQYLILKSYKRIGYCDKNVANSSSCAAFILSGEKTHRLSHLTHLHPKSEVLLPWVMFEKPSKTLPAVLQ